jgi:hypothetical protein
MSFKQYYDQYGNTSNRPGKPGPDADISKQYKYGVTDTSFSVAVYHGSCVA